MISNSLIYDPTINNFKCDLFASKTYVIYSATSSFIIPAILMGFIYVRIFMGIRTQAQVLEKNIPERRNALMEIHKATLDYQRSNDPTDENENENEDIDVTTSTLQSDIHRDAERLQQ